MQWKFGSLTVISGPEATIQTGMSYQYIQDVLDNNDLPAESQGRFIVEFEFDRPLGADMVVDRRPCDNVRFADDPTSKALPQNRRNVPFVLVERMTMSNNVCLILNRKGDIIKLVHAHFGAPWPPPAFTRGAKHWAGHPHIAEAGRKGSRAFWQECAFATTDRTAFMQMTQFVPAWLK